jgi:nitroreductase
MTEPMPNEAPIGLDGRAISGDSLGMLEGMCSTRAIRRYRSESVPENVLRDILFAASRAPSASNRQPFRFVVLTDGPNAQAAKRVLARGAREVWSVKRGADRYDEGSGTNSDSRKGAMARTMEHYVDHMETVPVLILACLVRHREVHITDGASIYPACQNLLLAARALGYGAVMTSWHLMVEMELRELLKIPEEVAMAASITLGRPVGHHGPVRRRPLEEFVYLDEWDIQAPFAVDPPGTCHTAAGPPRDPTRGWQQ